MRLPFVGVGAALCLVSSLGHAAPTAGLNMGAPVWNGVAQEASLQAAIATGAPHVRVNFRIDNWTSPQDTTKRGPAGGGGKTFFELYDHVIDEITSHGLEVYGLLSNEIVPPLGPGGTELPIESQAFEDAYVANALAVMDRYRDRVRVWETINEPNNWPSGTTSPLVSAAGFARLHARLYRDAKVAPAHANDACWGAVSILTGPLLSFEGTSSASYLDAAIAAGRANNNGPWQEVVTKTGRDPIDGVGYHIYVAQGSDSSEADVATNINANLDELRAVLASRGLASTDAAGKVWISEIGYQANLLTESGQATRLDSTFAALSARTDVASIQWFTVGDFNPEEWGLFRAGGFAAADARPAHASFVTRAKLHAPELAARLELVDLPKQAPAGSIITAKIKATNLGRKTWAAGQTVRLGAASGCPSSTTTKMNEMEWRPHLATDGYAKSTTDARRFLSSQSAQGESTIIEVPLLVPSAASRVGAKLHFAARMLDEGVAWFGSTLSADVDVLPATANAPPGSASGGGPPTTTAPPGVADQPNASSDSSTDGCACNATGSTRGAIRGSLFGLMLALIALLARRSANA